MTPRQTAETISKETGISIGLMLAMLGIIMAGPVSAIGAWMRLNNTITGMRGEVTLMNQKLENVIEVSDQRMKHEVQSINARLVIIEKEIERRAPIIYGMNDRFPIQDAVLMQDLNEKALKAAGVDVDLPNPMDMRNR